MELNKINQGDRLSMTYYLEVLDKKGDQIQVRDQNNNEFTIRGRNLIEKTIQSANQYSSTKKISRTELVDNLLGARDSVFSAEYTKSGGENRRLVGHLLGSETHMGRSNVIDLEIPSSQNPIRQIDHRTIFQLVLNGVRYVLK